MLSEAAVRIVARFLLVVYLLFSVDAHVWAEDFSSALNAGSSLGQSSVGAFNPQNLTQTLQNRGIDTSASSITPQIDQGQASRGQYENYYSNPGGMTGATSEIGDFVNNSYQTRTVYDLSHDPAFGNKCLATDVEGNCTMWSSSDSTIKNVYPDCEEVKIPIYDDPPTESYCTGTRNLDMVDCTVRTYSRIETETIDTPCEEAIIDYRPGQIYAVCKDYYDYWKQYMGTDSFRDDCYCPNNPNGYGCGDYVSDFILDAPPEGADYLGRRLSTSFNTCTEAEGWDYGNWNVYDWYRKYRNSVVERMYLDHDSPCGDMSQFSACTLNRLEQCDSAGDNCVVRIEDAVSTGASIVPPAAQLCSSFSGSLENYTMCMDNNLVLNDHTLTTTKEESTSGGLVRHYGGPDIPTSQWYQNGWYVKSQFACTAPTDNCQSLRDQGCTLYAQTCADPNDPYCQSVNYTYRCGGTGGIVGYDVAVVCDGNIRCMGSECKETSYDANKDFSKMAQVAEIMNALRMDSTDVEIFPGNPQSCQEGPIYCCNANTGGVSMFQYAMAMKSAYTLYSTMTTGITGASGTAAAMAESVTTTFNLLGQNVGLATVATEKLSTGVTMTTLTSELGATGVLTETSAAGATTASIAPYSIAQPLMYQLATAASVVGVIISAYVIATTVYQMVFACTEEDMVTSISLGFALCHLVGELKTGDFLGMKLKSRNVYCCFNSILARLVHEQGRPQVNRGWGSAEQPDCAGFSIGEFAALDFSQMNLAEYMQYVQAKSNISPAEMEAIKERAITSAGAGSPPP